MIRTRALWHRCAPGEEPVLRDVNLVVEAGEVVGISGRNGSGKSTLLRILATLTEPTEGEVTIDGVDVVLHPERVRGRIGYVSDAVFRPSDLTVREHLAFMADACGADLAVVDGVLELTDLASFERRPLRSLSRGESRRLLLAQVMLHDPDILLLDDPFSDVDPLTRDELLAMLDELASLGRTFVLTASSVDALTGFCTRVGALDQGSLQIEAPPLHAPSPEATPEA